VLGVVPLLGELFSMAWLGLWGALMPALGNAVFGIAEPIEVMQTGSGDMTWNYVLQFWFVVLSLAGATLWALLDRNRHDYARAYAWLRVVVRYALATAMLSYGLAKLTGNQFGPPDAPRLAETYGDSSPMGLAWTFMGFSTAYVWFTGLAELLGGVLLLSRRTATLGALVSCVVMANVVMINFCFDVPVKLYSSLLLLMGVFVAAPDTRRLLALLVWNQPTAPTDLSAPVLGRRGQIARKIVKGAYILMMVAMAIMQRMMVSEFEAMKKSSPLAGVYEVEAFARDGAAVALGEPSRWKKLVIGEYGYVAIQTADRESAYFAFKHDEATNTAKVIDRSGDEPVEYPLAVEQPAGASWC
jgi:uncharacterized membrane protein YphA (DoxX/SURF4 family)